MRSAQIEDEIRRLQKEREMLIQKIKPVEEAIKRLEQKISPDRQKIAKINDRIDELKIMLERAKYNEYIDGLKLGSIVCIIHDSLHRGVYRTLMPIETVKMVMLNKRIHRLYITHINNERKVFYGVEGDQYYVGVRERDGKLYWRKCTAPEIPK